jgi:hypothetical protein
LQTRVFVPIHHEVSFAKSQILLWARMTPLEHDEQDPPESAASTSTGYSEKQKKKPLASDDLILFLRNQHLNRFAPIRVFRSAPG